MHRHVWMRRFQWNEFGMRLGFQYFQTIAFLYLPTVIWLHLEGLKNALNRQHSDRIRKRIAGVRPYGSGNHGTWRPATVNPCVRVTRYDPGHHFAPHRDGAFVVDDDFRSVYTLQVFGWSTFFLRLILGSKEALNYQHYKIKIHK